MATINYQDIIKNNTLAPSQLTTLVIPNNNTVPLRKLLDRKLTSKDNGQEVGSNNYISQSSKYFIKAKAFQKNSFLPYLTKETIKPIRPQVFTNFKLKKNDILISKDSNIGETIILERDLPNHTISNALYRLPITKNKYYLLAFLKHNFFLKQLDILVPKGATIRHAKTLFLDCIIPLPKNNCKQIIDYVELLTKSIINKEKQIRTKHKKILESIKKELLNNQKKIKFKNKTVTSFKTLKEFNRIDAGYYCIDYRKKKFIITNYKHGNKNLQQWGYSIKRGQNLGIRQIGRSIYSDELKNNFYTLIRPTSFSDFGTVEKFESLGNSKELLLLKNGDIVFSAEGTIGKCILFTNPQDKCITNVHGIILHKADYDIQESAFVSCYLRYLKYIGIYDYISVGGQGGSLAQKYLEEIDIPVFPKEKQKKIANLYYFPIKYPTSLNKENFLEKDNLWNKHAGILQLDKSIKNSKIYLNIILDKIMNNEKINSNNYNFFKCPIRC